MNKEEKVYACIKDDGTIIVVNRRDVDSAIKDAEELRGDMGFTVVGPIKTKEVVLGGLQCYVIRWNDGVNDMSEVFIGKTASEVLKTFNERKGIKAGSKIKMTALINCTNEVKDYFR